MKNLLPHFTIGLLAVTGLLWKGVWGGVIGLVGGYVVVTLFGLLLVAASGGILPRKARQDTASSFCEENADQLREIIPEGHEGREAEYIEKLLERIIRKATVIGPSTSSGMSFAEVAAAVKLIEDEEPNAREAIERLWMLIQRDWYGV